MQNLVFKGLNGQFKIVAATQYITRIKDSTNKVPITRQGLTTEVSLYHSWPTSHRLTGSPERSEYFLAGVKEGGASMAASVETNTSTCDHMAHRLNYNSRCSIPSNLQINILLLPVYP